jgi:hypothetical protein
VRSAALSLLGAIGKDDQRTFPVLSNALNEGYELRNFNLFSGAAEALIVLGDERGLGTFEDLSKKATASPQIVATISSYESRLRAKLTPAKPGS